MLALLGSVFSSARIYLYVGLAVAALALFAYVEHLRAETANAHASLATAQATITEARATLDTDNATIVTLQMTNKITQDTLEEAQHQTLAVQQALAQAEKDLANVPEPKTCQSLDARDRAAISGVRGILGSAPTH